MEENVDVGSSEGQRQDQAQRNPIDALTKEELINKYKGLLGIAKKAKQAKDELTEENRQLRESLANCETQREADKKALLTMKEMLEEFTDNKLRMATQLSELQKKSKTDDEALAQLGIENESLKRQLDRMAEENEELLKDIDYMEGQQKQVNLLGLEQKKHLSLLELEVNKLKETESTNVRLQSQVAESHAAQKTLQEKLNETIETLATLEEKYKSVKEVNSEQRKKFNALKDRFVDVLRKLKNLKECKRVLLETQHEYADAVSKWQVEIIRASQWLVAQMNALRSEKEELARRLQQSGEHLPAAVEMSRTAASATASIHVDAIACKVEELHRLSAAALEEQNAMTLQLTALQEENRQLRGALARKADPDSQEQQQLEVLQQEVLQSVEQHQEQAADIHSECMAQVKQLQREKSELFESIKALEGQLKALIGEKEYMHEEIRDLSGKLRDNEKLRDDLQELRDVLKTTEKEKKELLARCELVNVHKQGNLDTLAGVENAYDEMKFCYEQKESENAELLDEMRELNEALKARGDVISRQQEKQQELVAELKKTTTKLKQFEERLSEKEQSISAKDEQVRDISREVDEARQKVQQLESSCARHEVLVRTMTEELQSLRSGDVTADAQSDVLSTSTISRAEEVTRLRELDESFEDKYNKLRGMAMKLKKKLQEQTAYAADLERQQQQQTADGVALRKEFDDCKKELAQLQKEQAEQQKQLEAVRADNQKLKSSRKQANVLNLEIEAAEKSLSDTAAKLASKTSELEMLHEALASKESTIVQLRKEIALLEAAKEAECVHSKELKGQMDRLQEQIRDAVHHKQNTLAASKDLEVAHETLKLEKEELSMQLAQSESKQEAALTLVRDERAQVERKLMETTDALKSTQQELKTAERSLEDLRVQYVEYKVKAQAVLRKNQSKDTTQQRELDEELLALRAVERQLQAELQAQTKKLTECSQQIELLTDDNASLERRSKELLNVIEELRQQNDTLALENRKQLQLQQETLRSHRMQLEQLEGCHKMQLADLADSHQRLLEQLKTEHAKTTRIPPLIGAALAKSSTATASDQSKIDFLLMEREDAEGSEEAIETLTLAAAAARRKISNSSNPMRRSQHDFMPLDELLNAPMNAISDTVTTITSTSLGRVEGVDANASGELVQLELHATKERLHKQETQMRHLTSLLAENEQDLAKLTQQNDMLKEELRRQERAVDREKHMHNSEYLKNVFLKFLTLNNGDERTRLVPVLNTILRLSRTEMELLNCVAKGQKVPADGSNRGWTNFLPSWGGSNNNN